MESKIVGHQEFIFIEIASYNISQYSGEVAFDTFIICLN